MSGVKAPMCWECGRDGYTVILRSTIKKVLRPWEDYDDVPYWVCGYCGYAEQMKETGETK